MNKIKSLLIIIFFLFTFENSIAQWSQSLGPETGDITSICAVVGVPKSLLCKT